MMAGFGQDPRDAGEKQWLPRRIWIQREPWLDHIRRYRIGVFFVSNLFLCALATAGISLVLPSFFKFLHILANLLFLLGYAILWLFIKEGPPFLSNIYGIPIEASYNNNPPFICDD